MCQLKSEGGLWNKKTSCVEHSHARFEGWISTSEKPQQSTSSHNMFWAMPLFLVLAALGLGCTHCETGSRVTLCIDFHSYGLSANLPLVAIAEETADAQMMSGMLEELEMVDKDSLEDGVFLDCCQVFETNGIPAFVVAVDFTTRIIRRIQCSEILRSSYGFYVVPSGYGFVSKMNEVQMFRNEEYVACVEKLFERSWKSLP